jgi:hypothetical protein
MTKAQKTKYVAKLIDKWQEKLLLQFWDINFTLAKTDSDDLWDADIRCDSVYRMGLITIYPRYWHLQEKYKEKAIVHELCHCIAEPINRLLRVSNEVTSLHRIDTNENMVEHFTKVLSGR